MTDRARIEAVGRPLQRGVYDTRPGTGLVDGSRYRSARPRRGQQRAGHEHRPHRAVGRAAPRISTSTSLITHWSTCRGRTFGAHQPGDLDARLLTQAACPRRTSIMTCTTMTAGCGVRAAAGPGGCGGGGQHHRCGHHRHRRCHRLPPGWHIMSSCRIGDMPDDLGHQVSGPDLGRANLFIADASSLTTSAAVNRTSTLQAVAVRCAESSRRRYPDIVAQQKPRETRKPGPLIRSPPGKPPPATSRPAVPGGNLPGAAVRETTTTAHRR